MAIAGHPGAIHYAATDTTGESTALNTIEMSVNGELIDVTTFSDTSGFHLYVQALKDVTFSVSGFYDSSDTAQALMITHAGNGTTGYIRYLPNGSTGFKCAVKVQDYKVGADVTGAVTFSATLKSTAALGTV